MKIFESFDSQAGVQLQIHKFENELGVPVEIFLNSQELNYFRSLQSEKRKNQYSQVRYILKNELAKILQLAPQQIVFNKIGRGKPVLSGSSILDFNVSHSDEYFAIALSQSGQVGVDIEKLPKDRNIDGIAHKYFASLEIDHLSICPDEKTKNESFARLWSGKEAIIKVVAGGIFKDVRDIQIDPVDWKIWRLPIEFGELSDWSLHFIDQIPGYMCSIAHKKKS